jgi:hypothetical protein
MLLKSIIVLQQLSGQSTCPTCAAGLHLIESVDIDYKNFVGDYCPSSSEQIPCPPGVPCHDRVNIFIHVTHGVCRYILPRRRIIMPQLPTRYLQPIARPDLMPSLLTRYCHHRCYLSSFFDADIYQFRLRVS